WPGRPNPDDRMLGRIVAATRNAHCIPGGGRRMHGHTALDTALQFQEAAVVIKPATVPVGVRIEVCYQYSGDVPSGWAEVEWKPDATRCPVDGVGIDPTQPNVLIAQRNR